MKAKRLPPYPKAMTSWLDKENKVVVSCIRDGDDRDYVYILGGERLHRQAIAPELCSKFESHPQGKKRRRYLEMDN
ncbi:unnamed protein product [Eruca vesicaria subsp. sativa]|uniref:Uncharacterized protein n=1 Tax=Eruca vesicaria subsp. sativa TaxID=29727 RepID=A0ABC8JZ76_ERUVS|nr:unnamed protein product [Eruca vesicaria subsp. sativa]